MGMAGPKMESLFLGPEFHRRGGGRRLIEHARARHGGLTVDVNEQNTAAVAFYEACGFFVDGIRAGRSRPSLPSPPPESR
jgi:putative acetyltransferase